MWKENYRIGVPEIDAQHYTLFLTADRLFKTIRDNPDGGGREAYEEVVGFMKQYVVRHFADEERYQATIAYAGLEAHRKEHRAFTQTVLAYEKQMRESGFAMRTVKAFAGTLLTWLIYHVAKEDQKYARPQALETAASPEQFLDCFAQSAGEVVQKMSGVAFLGTRRTADAQGLPVADVAVRLEVVGEARMAAAFAFPQAFAFRLLKNMTFMEVTQIDELVRSAMAEIVNITGGNVATMLQARGLACDIKPPEIALGDAFTARAAGICVLTDIGELGIVLESL